MILKTKEGVFIELTEKEYIQFVAELLVHFQSEKKIELYFQTDTRIDAANMLLRTVAEQRNSMSDDTKENYYKTAHELLEGYNQDTKKIKSNQ